MFFVTCLWDVLYAFLTSFCNVFSTCTWWKFLDMYLVTCSCHVLRDPSFTYNWWHIFDMYFVKCHWLVHYSMFSTFYKVHANNISQSTCQGYVTFRETFLFTQDHTLQSVTPSYFRCCIHTFHLLALESTFEFTFIGCRW